MNDQPVQTLQRLIARYGDELTADPRRTEALLNDYCPAYRTEVFVLVNAQRQQVPADLLATPGWMPTDAAAARLSKRLQERLALSAEAADWAVRSWAIALGLRRNPTALSRLLDRARILVAPRPRPHPAASESGQSDSIGVQSHATSGTADSANTSEPSTPSVPPEPTPGTAPAKPRSVRGHVRVTAVVTTLAALWLLAVSLPSWLDTVAWPETLASFTGLHDQPSAVAAIYPLPRMAWVSDGPLHVRSGPDMTQPPIAMLPAGETVRVTRYSDDTQWSHIVEPTEGWVNNWYLAFLSDDGPSDGPTITVRLLHRDMTAASDETAVHRLPDASSGVVGQLDAGETVVVVADTFDGLWRQTAQPVVGWVQADRLVPD